jgi:hypothetical protein
MVPGAYNIVAQQGSTLPIPFTLKNPDGSPVNLAGCTPRMQVRASAASTTVILDCTAYLTIPDAAGGKVQLLVPDDVMATIAARQPPFAPSAPAYVYDLDVEMADGSKDTWLAGTFTVLAEVTR